MKYSLIAAAALVFATAAYAAGPSDCVKLQKQASEAIAAAQPGRAQDEAKNLARAGATFCATSMYAQGVARYNQALQLLAQG